MAFLVLSVALLCSRLFVQLVCMPSNRRALIQLVFSLDMRGLSCERAWRDLRCNGALAGGLGQVSPGDAGDQLAATRDTGLEPTRCAHAELDAALGIQLPHLVVEPISLQLRATSLEGRGAAVVPVHFVMLAGLSTAPAIGLVGRQ